MNVEQERQKYHRRTVVAYRKGNDYRWVACLAASRIVGRYDEGATLALANDLAVTKMQVTRLARAGVTYRRLRRYNPEVTGIRKALSPTHFAVMGELAIKHDLDEHYMIEQLRTAAREGASVASLRSSVDGENNAYYPLWIKHYKNFVRMADYLVEDSDTPDNVRSVAGLILDLIERGSIPDQDQLCVSPPELPARL